MGTNFHLLDGRHLGKRGAAGQYCTNCDISLVTGQPGGADFGMNPADDRNPHAVSRYDAMNKACPKCGGFRHPNAPFYQPELCRPTQGEINAEQMEVVQQVYSFSYAMNPWDIHALNRQRKVVSEYGDKTTIDEFEKMVAGAKFWFTSSVGREFS